jgi:tRNA threonylcarbamoyladenosine biosynthesis protein TsaB
MQHQPVILAIETTGPYASVAVSGVLGPVTEDSLKGKPLSERPKALPPREEGILELINHTDYSHLEEIAPMVKEILATARMEPEDLDAIAVSRGPGSFTGIRIGMATAKGFAQVWEKPLLCVPTLASFAFGDFDWSDFAEGLIPANILICPLFDARRSQVYAGVYAPETAEPLLPDAAYDVPAYLEKLAALAASKPGCTAVFFGDGCDAAHIREALENSGISHVFAPKAHQFQKASSDLNLALQLYKAGRFTDCYGAEPEYLRLAEAERKLKSGELKSKAEGTPIGIAGRQAP